MKSQDFARGDLHQPPGLKEKKKKTPPGCFLMKVPAAGAVSNVLMFIVLIGQISFHFHVLPEAKHM